MSSYQSSHTTLQHLILHTLLQKPYPTTIPNQIENYIIHQPPPHHIFTLYCLLTYKNYSTMYSTQLYVYHSFLTLLTRISYITTLLLHLCCLCRVQTDIGYHPILRSYSLLYSRPI